MGCYPPLVKFVSKALGKCNGRERWREGRLDMDYAMAYPPGPPMHTHYMQPVARTVTFASNNNVLLIPLQKTPPPSSPPPPQQQEQERSTPEPPQQQQTPPQQAEPDRHDSPPQPQPAEQPEEQPAPEQEKAPDAAPPAEPKPPRGPRRGKNKKPGGRVRFGPEQQAPPQQEEQQHEEPSGGTTPGHHQGGQQQQQQHSRPAPAYLFRYTPSPLPRWEATPRRHEYFSGEYRSYYPTPVREGIYRIATDANRLTTIFSEENPNACAIV